MNEKDYEIAFQIILHAGNSKSKAMLAMSAARTKDYDQAEKLYQESVDELNEAHLVQTKMIQDEASGIKTEMNLILVHAQDHISMATVLSDVALELIHIYKTTQRIEG